MKYAFNDQCSKGMLDMHCITPLKGVEVKYKILKYSKVRYMPGNDRCIPQGVIL